MQQSRSLAFGLRCPSCRTSTTNVINYNKNSASPRSFFQTSRLLLFSSSPTPTPCNSSSSRQSSSYVSEYVTAAATGTGARTALWYSSSCVEGGISGAEHRSDRSSRKCRRRLGWWGRTSSGLRPQVDGNSALVRHQQHHQQQQQQQQRQLLLPLQQTARSASTKSFGEGGEAGGKGAGEGRDEVEEEEEDVLLASLIEELVWKEGDDDGDNDDGEGNEGDHDPDGGGGEAEGDEEWTDLDGLDLKQMGMEFMDDENSDEVKKELQRKWGMISLENDQTDYEIDTAALEAKLRKAMEVLGCQAWDVGVVVTTDKDVAQLNSQYRGMKKSTDILSFPMEDMSDNPGVLPKVRFPAEMDLGDMFISLAYVDRQIARDRQEQDQYQRDREHHKDGADGTDGTEGDDWWDKERGVSGAMSRVFDVQERVSMLLVHGLIHLLGYDHETEEDYEEMVRVEEKVIAAVFSSEAGE